SGGGDGDELEHRNAQRANVQDAAEECRKLQDSRPFSEDDDRDVLNDEEDAERRDEQRDRRCPDERPERDAAYDDREQDREDDAERNHQGEWDAVVEHHDRRVSRPDEHDPEGEIDQTHDAEDERQAQREECIGGSDAERIDDVLDELGHEVTPGAIPKYACRSWSSCLRASESSSMTLVPTLITHARSAKSSARCADSSTTTTARPSPRTCLRDS